MTTEERTLDVLALRESFAKAPDDFFALFYDRLNKRHPHLWDPEHVPHFPPMGSPGMRAQEAKLGAALADALVNLEDADYLRVRFGLLGRKHAELGALGEEDVVAVAGALLATFQAVLGDAFTDYLKAQWTLAYITLIDLMKAGADSTP